MNDVVFDVHVTKEMILKLVANELGHEVDLSKQSYRVEVPGEEGPHGVVRVSLRDVEVLHV